MSARATEPARATPSATPTCREAPAIPEAAPDCEGGSPSTAVVEMGGLMKPRPAPAIIRTTTKYHVLASARRKVSSRLDAATQAPPVTSAGRVPLLAMSRPARGELTARATASGSRRAPVPNGVYPKGPCRSSEKRKRKLP